MDHVAVANRDDARTVLDRIDDISVPGDVFREPTNEFWALLCLRDGLDFLYHQARRCDESVLARVGDPSKVNHFAFGTLPEFDEVPQKLLTCGFLWYAVSACQYVQTVGAIAYQSDSTRPLPPEYVKKVIPELKSFRDKVAAHFAWSTKNERDNDAERLASILPQLTFQENSWHVAGMTVGVGKSGKFSTSQALTPWSLCSVHEQLRKRYW